MTQYSEWIAAAIIAGTFLIILIGTEIWYILKQPRTEITRKFAHVMAGLTCLSFSYVIHTHWIVLILVLLFIGLMYITKKTGLLQAVHNVDRPSSGAMYFPIAVYITYLLSSIYDQPHFYVISILVLTVSDSLAALIGVIYGSKKYEVESKQQKSLEGTTVFFLTTFLITHLGLLLLSDIGRVESVLCALLVALLITAFESIAVGGADNLFIPIGTWLVLMKCTSMPTPEILQDFLVLGIVFLVFMAAIRLPKPRLGSSALIGITLLGYSAWSLVSFNWFVTVLLGVILFSQSRLIYERAPQTREILRIKPIFYVGILPCFWIVLADLLNEWQSILLLPFIISLVSQFSLSWHRNSRQHRDALEKVYPKVITRARSFLRAIILTLLFIPLQFVFESAIPVAFSMIIGFLGILLVDRLYWLIADQHPRDWKQPSERAHFMKLSLAARTIGSLVVLGSNLVWYHGWISF